MLRPCFYPQENEPQYPLDKRPQNQSISDNFLVIILQDFSFNFKFPSTCIQLRHLCTSPRCVWHLVYRASVPTHLSRSYIMNDDGIICIISTFLHFTMPTNSAFAFQPSRCHLGQVLQETSVAIHNLRLHVTYCTKQLEPRTVYIFCSVLLVLFLQSSDLNLLESTFSDWKYHDSQRDRLEVMIY
jgi:hypothetical protein